MVFEHRALVHEHVEQLLDTGITVLDCVFEYRASIRYKQTELWIWSNTMHVNHRHLHQPHDWSYIAIKPSVINKYYSCRTCVGLVQHMANKSCWSSIGSQYININLSCVIPRVWFWLYQCCSYWASARYTSYIVDCRSEIYRVVCDTCVAFEDVGANAWTGDFQTSAFDSSRYTCMLL